MRRGTAAWLVAALLAAATLVGLVGARRTAPAPGDIQFEAPFEATHSWRGNLHAHTNLSDGANRAEDVYAWYGEHGYHFVAITDHDLRLDPAAFAETERPGAFVILAGEEITMFAPGGVPVHVNAICHQTTIGGGDFPSVGAALARGVAEVRAQGGVALVNHPNFQWALQASDLHHARGAQLLEIWSGHPGVHGAGDVFRPSAEAIWDEALRAGERFSAVAVDDVHDLDADAEHAGPGRAWVEVFAGELTHAALCDALAAGRLYASSGARLRRLSVRAREMVVEAEPGATVEFLDERGSLDEQSLPAGGAATYRLRGRERWVRARVTMPDGARAWTQPFRTTGSGD